MATRAGEVTLGVSFVSDLLSNQLGKKLVKMCWKIPTCNFQNGQQSIQEDYAKCLSQMTKTWKKQWHPVAFQRFQHVLASQFSPERRFASSPVMTSCSLRLIKMLPFTQLSAMETSGLEWRRTSRWWNLQWFPFPSWKKVGSSMFFKLERHTIKTY